MKRAISIILTVLLLVSCVFALVACGSGIKSEEDWNKAINYHKTCDAVTVKYKSKIKVMNHLVDRRSDKDTVEITYDGKNGVVHLIDKYSYLIGGISGSKATIEHYYVLDGARVIHYKRKLNDDKKTWEVNVYSHFAGEAEAKAYLRELYLLPGDKEQHEYTDVTALKYSSSAEYSGGKFKFDKSEQYWEYAYELKFSGGKLTKYSYEAKQKSSGPKDSVTFEMTVKYKGSVTLPSDLPKA